MIVDQVARAQIKLLLEHLGSEYRSKADDLQREMQSNRAAKRVLQSGGTVKAALRIVEENAAEYVKSLVSAVAEVAKDTEAFALIATDVVVTLRHFRVGVDQAVEFATGGDRENRYLSVSNEAERLFQGIEKRTLRLLELHRYTFTQPAPPRQVSTPSFPESEPTIPSSKNKGGKPLAAHWDEMWAAVAVQIYTGDLQPKTQADIERAMLASLSEQGVEPGETAVRARARQLWRKYEQAS
ncbi:hypothetical protein H9L12_09450 [Sphingomonas rhizophila]|uniref:Uncharacterized protein n=1 Tax=Sphingomonas rhizophila TaxID=2071607 RepID=A0A7G9S9K6_9SPHN|nr:hypothetical protein [Sphingomonas rhizophila]QNN64531.1 hypothetical protein H9L12_09450 [Sphingomonas rhizophila]